MAKEACIRWGAHWRQLANIIEPFMCGGYTAFMANYFDHLLNFGTLAHLLEQMKLGSSQLECRC